MKRLQLYITQNQYARLAAMIVKDGLSLAEHIRRAIDLYLKELK